MYSLYKKKLACVSILFYHEDNYRDKLNKTNQTN